METGSGSMTDSGGSSTNSSTESLNGLKFGQKIYFENTSSGVGATTVGTPTISGPGSSNSSGSGKKARGGMVPPRCQVEGCRVDLSDAKAYYSRHKVCGMHSKAPKAIVAGLEQRFCQQCSRFHQLPEFDQGKRSCRRRLAGHNERRRKPPPGSLLTSCSSQLSLSIIERGNRGGSFIMDFAAYPRLSRRNVGSTLRPPEQVSANLNTGTEWFPYSWQNNSENPPPNLFLQGTPAGIGVSSAGIPPGECITGVFDSNRALSLLSNQPWGAHNQALTLGVNDMINTEVSSSVSQQALPHGAVMNPYPNASCFFKGDDSGSSSHEMPPHVGLGRFSEPINRQFSGELQLSHQSRRQHIELEPSNADNTSMQHIHHTL